MTGSLYMVPPLTAIFWHVLITTTCRPASLFELLDCQPSICSFLRLSAWRKATVNSEFTKERGSRKKQGAKCVIFIQLDWWEKKGGDREERGERKGKKRRERLNLCEGEIKTENQLIRLLYMQHFCFNYILFLLLFHLKLTFSYFVLSEALLILGSSSVLLYELVQSQIIN